MTSQDFDPLFGEVPEEIPLANAPLARVVAQVRFAQVMRVQQPDYVAGFQDRIRREYPHMQSEVVNTFVFGAEAGASTTIWRFFDASRNWRISLSNDFLSIETMKYLSREDFVGRLSMLLKNLGETIGPSHVSRLGVRYVDRVALDAGLEMKKMLRAEMGGIKNALPTVKHSISEFEADTKEGTLLVRWGHLPPNGSHEPEIMPPVAQPAWFLDVDSFQSYHPDMIEFDSGALATKLFDLAARSYTFFRWSVTDQFIELFKGEAE